MSLLLWVMFCAPFVLLSVSYRALPPELPVLRLWIGHLTLWASKSIFMVFRVPLMNLIHGLMTAVMLSQAPAFNNRERRISYSNLFLTLLFTIALKSDFEALECSVSAAPALFGPYARWLGFGTFTSVVAGVALSLWRGRKAPLPWPELQLVMRDKFILIGLFSLYVAIVAASLFSSHRVEGAVPS